MSDAINIVAIYYDTSDHPDMYVARMFHVDAAGIITASRELTAKEKSIEELRSKLPRGLVRLERCAYDDPKIVETWV